MLLKLLGVSGEEPEQPTTETMHVSDITIRLEIVIHGKNTFTNAVAKVTIFDVDTDGNPVNPVEGATVYGTWSGATSDADSGITNASGQVSLESNKVKNPPSGTTFTFTVDDVVTKVGWTYDLGANIETSDSITVE